MSKSKKRRKKDKRGGVDYLTEEQIKQRAEKRSESFKKKHMEVEALYETLLKEVPEIRRRFLDKGLTAEGTKEKSGTDKLISNLTKMLPGEEEASKKTVARLRRSGSQINLSKEDRTKERVKIIRKVANKLREKEEFKNSSNRKISKEVEKKLREEGVNIPKSTVRQYLGKKGDKILGKRKKKKEKKIFVPSKQVKEVRKNLDKLKKSGIIDKTVYDKKNLNNLPAREIIKLGKITDKVIEKNKRKLNGYKDKIKEEREEIKSFYKKGKAREMREELNELGYELSAMEQVLPLCNREEKKKLIEKARKNPSKDLFEIKKELEKQ